MSCLNFNNERKIRNLIFLTNLVSFLTYPFYLCFMEITSLQNPKIKQLVRWQQKSKERKQHKLFVVEGVQENQLALDNGFVAQQFFIQEDLFHFSFEPYAPEIFNVTQEVFNKIAYRQTTGGIIGVYQSKTFGLDRISSIKNPLIVVLENVEKPGNLGAVLRSCDAVNADAVVVCDERVDFFNPNVIRSSVGTVFTNRLISINKPDLVAFCQEHKIQILATYLRDNTQDLYQQNLQRATALVFGTESTGLSDFWATHASATIKIPMQGQADSLNVSNAVAVCLYESLRQRNLKP